VEADKERVLGVGHEHLPLGLDVLHLVVLLDLLFGEDLHGVELGILFVLDQEHLSKAALSDNLQHIKIFQCDLALLSHHLLGSQRRNLDIVCQELAHSLTIGIVK